MSQFEFLVMTEKNIFTYKLFLSWNISDFIFYVKIATTPEKSYPPLSQQSHLKVEVLSSPPPLFWKFGWRFNPLPPQPPAEMVGGEHYVDILILLHGAWNFNWILPLQNLVCFLFYCYSQWFYGNYGQWFMCD